MFKPKMFLKTQNNKLLNENDMIAHMSMLATHHLHVGFPPQHTYIFHFVAKI